MSWARQIVLASVIALAGMIVAGCGQANPEKLLASAKERLAKGERNAATIELKNLLQQSPDNGEARFLLGQTELESRDAASAEKEFRRALQAGYPEERVLPLLARAMVEQDEFDGLIRDYGNRNLADQTAEAEFKALLGEAYIRRGTVDQARSAFAAALVAVPGYPRARLGEATLLAMERKFSESLSIVDEVIASKPSLGEAYLLKSNLQLIQGDRQGSRKTLEQGVAANSEFLPVRLVLLAMLMDDKAYDEVAKQLDDAKKIAGPDLRIHYFDSLLAFRQGNIEKARDGVLQILKRLPDHAPSLVLAGAIELQAGHLASAETYLKQAIARAPGSVDARKLLVSTYLRMNQPARASEELQPLVERGVARVNPQIAMLAGETYLANGDVKEATAFFTQAASSKAEQAEARTRLGQIALATGRTEEGFKELETASELDPGKYQSDLVLVSVYLQRGELDKATEAVKALEKKQPKNPLTFQMSAMVDLARHDAKAARKSLERALELQPNYLPSAISLAELDFAEKKPEDARKRYEAMIARDPKNEDLYLALANFLVRSGASAQDIRSTVQRAIDANPQAVRARLALISHDLETGDTKSALSMAQSAVANMPSDPRVLDVLGFAQERAGETAQAVETYNKLVNLQPQRPQPLLRLGALYARQKETGKAIDALRRAQKLVPSPRDLVAPIAQVLVSAGRYDDALREARELQRREPKFAGGWKIEGDIFLAERKYAEAERAYREALKVEPKANALVTQLHAALIAANKKAEADALTRKWFSENPKDTVVRLYLAEQDLKSKNLKSAAAAYRTVLALEPRNVIALNNLAWVAGEMGDPKAVTYAELAMAVAPNNAAVADTLGMLLVNKGETSKGLEYLDRARKLAPARYDVRLHYAKALMKANSKKAAREELEALQSVQADFPGKSEIPALLNSL